MGIRTTGIGRLRRRLGFLFGAALASWAVVGLIGYGVYCLLLIWLRSFDADTSLVLATVRVDKQNVST